MYQSPSFCLRRISHGETNESTGQETYEAHNIRFRSKEVSIDIFNSEFDYLVNGPRVVQFKE